MLLRLALSPVILRKASNMTLLHGIGCRYRRHGGPTGEDLLLYSDAHKLGPAPMNLVNDIFVDLQSRCRCMICSKPLDRGSLLSLLP